MKTAVEWLQSQYRKYGAITPTDFKQAKQMEKEQIVEAWDEGYTNGGDNWGYGSDKTGKQYYNETYKSE